MSLVPAGFGLVLGLAGLAEWAVHPAALVKLLSCARSRAGQNRLAPMLMTSASTVVLNR